MIRDSTRASQAEPPIISLSPSLLDNFKTCLPAAWTFSYNQFSPRQAVKHLATDWVAFGFPEKLLF